MAKNGRRGAGRKGEIKKRLQVFNPRNKRFTKMDMSTGLFIDQMAKAFKAFRGVKRKYRKTRKK
ncbi:hypothetical protein HY969_04625 [Candidatus Kaiserbacteria bacterium]|nr:hypothetical protein [Candidatus Kaiserbacteria bacterium]